MTLSTLGVRTLSGWGVHAGLGGQLAVHPRVALRGNTGVLYRDDAGVLMRDSQLFVGVDAVQKPGVRLTLSGGVGVPTGRAGTALGVAATSTGSVDPWAGVDFFWGSTWLLAVNAQGRAPLYAGTDAVKQGPYGNVSVLGGRRLGPIDGVLAGGVAAAGATGPGRFQEIALSGQFVWMPAERWGVGAQVRVPLNPAGANYRASAGVSVTRVLQREHGHDAAPEAH